MVTTDFQSSENSKTIEDYFDGSFGNLLVTSDSKTSEHPQNVYRKSQL